MQRFNLQQFDKNMMIGLAGVGFLLALLFGLGNLVAALVFAVFILMPGLALLAWFDRYPESKWLAVLPVPALLIAGTGAMLLFQSITGYWESWAYAWTLYGVFFGMGLVMTGDRLEEPAFNVVGRGSIVVSGVAFVVLGAFFIMLTSHLLQLLFFAALFAGIAYFFIKRHEPTSEPKRKVSSTRRVKIIDGESREVA